MLKTIITPIAKQCLRFLLPQLCPICTSEVTASGLCGDCWSSIKLISTSACLQCSTPFDYVPLLTTCGNCLRQPPDVDQVVAAMVYDGFSRQMILGLKYGDRQDIAPILAKMMQAKSYPLIQDADFIIPLPLHPSRFFRRQFNQSAELTRYLLAPYPEMQGKFTTAIMMRRKKTAPQGRQTKKQRRDNLRNAFHVPESQKPALKGKNVLIIDDVMASGASINSAAACLKRAGVNTVSASVVARVC